MTDLFLESDCDCSSRMIGDPTTGFAFMERASISLEKCNRLYRERVLAKGVRVYGGRFCLNAEWSFVSHQHNGNTHTALLINVEEIEKDSLEKVAREFIKTAHIEAFDDSDWGKLAARFKRLLGGE